MILLPKDFEITKYGVTVRLVTEDDAEFITRLRSDERLGRFIHASNGDVEAQKKWVTEYKKRENEGIEYYFIFLKDGIPYGLERIYNIDWTHLSFTSGSWLCEKDTAMEYTLLTLVIAYEIAYDMLGLKINLFDVRKENKKVLKFHRNIMCSHQYAETELDYLFMSTPETRKNSKLKKYLEIE